AALNISGGRNHDEHGLSLRNDARAGSPSFVRGVRDGDLRVLLARVRRDHLLPLVRQHVGAQAERINHPKEIHAMIESKGKAFRRLLAEEPYVFTGGVYSPLDAQIAEKVGIKAIYLSGYSVAMANGWPDMGFLTQTEVARIASMVASAVDVPIIADA